MINWEVHTLLCSSQFAASPFVTILGCFVSFPLSYFVSAYLSSDSYRTHGIAFIDHRNDRKLDLMCFFILCQ